MREISSTENWLLITLSMALSGVIYGLIAFPGEPVIIGAVFAVLMGLPMIAFERRIFLRPLHRRSGRNSKRRSKAMRGTPMNNAKIAPMITGSPG